MPDYIARFEVLEKIGEGGMGAVFKARDPHISRIVAIKLLREGFDSKDMRERFMQEARSAGGLQNPHIVTIFELGEHGGAPFIVMEFVVGDTVDRLIKRRAPISLIRKLELIEVLCAGLGYAHHAGVIHRDIKPANLIVSSDGTLKILDFGIARVGNSELTRTGMLMGTPNYMPPEQLNGQRIDKRADIFAVGAVFYELLAYQRAFPGNYAEAITRILGRDPEPLARLCEGLDPQIEAVVLKAIEKNPDRRYQDLADMRRDLVRIRMRLERDLPSADTVVFMSSAEGAAEQLLQQTTVRRAEAEVETAHRLFEEGETAEAIRRLEEFEPPHEVVSEALAALRDRADEQERQAQRESAIARAMESANDAFERHDHTAAIRWADEVLLIDEGHGPARELRRRARAALDEQRRSAELERRANQTIEDARRLFVAGEHQAAIGRLAAFQPAHAAVATTLAELRAEAERLRAEAEAIAKRAADRRRADALVEQGLADLAAGRASAALAAATDALQLVPDDERARSLGGDARAELERARVRAEQDRAAAAVVEGSEASFRSGQHRAALEALERFPLPHPVVEAALARLSTEYAEIERQAREAEEHARAEARAREEAARREREEAARREREEAARREREEAARREREEIARREREEAARREREEIARREREEADRKAEAARLAKEQAEREAKKEADRKAREAALAEETRLTALAATRAAEVRERERKDRERKEREEKEKKEEAARQERQKEEQHAKEQAARQAKAEKERLAKEVADRATAEAHARRAELAAIEARQQQERERQQQLAAALAREPDVEAATRQLSETHPLEQRAVDPKKFRGAALAAAAGLVVLLSVWGVVTWRRSSQVTSAPQTPAGAAPVAGVAVGGANAGRSDVQPPRVEPPTATNAGDARAGGGRATGGSGGGADVGPAGGARGSTTGRADAGLAPAGAGSGRLANGSVAAARGGRAAGDAGAPPPVAGARGGSPVGGGNSGPVAADTSGVSRGSTLGNTPGGSEAAGGGAPATGNARGGSDTGAAVGTPTGNARVGQETPGAGAPSSANNARGVPEASGAGGAPAAGGGAAVPGGATATPAVGRGGADLRAADEQAIQQVLNQYVAAYNGRDAAAVARLVPAQPPVDFSQYRSYKLALAGVRVDVEGNAATVTCTRQIDVVVTRGNQTFHQAPPTTFRLRRSGGSWIIDSVR